MEKIMGEIMQEHVDRLMMLGTLSADEFTELVAISQCGDNRVSVSKGRRGSKTAI